MTILPLRAKGTCQRFLSWKRQSGRSLLRAAFELEINPSASGGRTGTAIRAVQAGQAASAGSECPSPGQCKSGEWLGGQGASEGLRHEKRLREK